MTKSELKTSIENWDNEELMEMFALFLDRVHAVSTFLQNEEGLLTHEVMVFQAEDKVIVSDPKELDWPLVPALQELLPKKTEDEANGNS